MGLRKSMTIIFAVLFLCYAMMMAYFIGASSKDPRPVFEDPTEMTISVLKAEAKTVKATKKKKTKKAKKTKAKYSASYFKCMGVIKWKGDRWTWYSQRVLPGGGLKIKGRHVDSKGYICDYKDRIVLSSNKYRKGKVLKTPFGKKGIVLDDGCPWVDVYTDW